MSSGDGISFANLLDLRVEKLADAASEWLVKAVRMDSAEQVAQDPGGMESKARETTWQGENAAVTVPFVLDTAQEIGRATSTVRTIYNLLRDGHTRLRGHQSRLQNIVDAIGTSWDLHIDGSGRIQLTDAAIRELEENPESTYDGQARITAMVERIEAVLKDTAEADASLALALRDALGHDPHRFTGVDYSGLVAAEQAYADAQRMVELGSLEELSDSELEEFHSLALLYGDDPAFAERVALGLGPAKLLDLWNGLVNPALAVHPEREAAVSELQQSLGTLMGLATHSSPRR